MNSILFFLLPFLYIIFLLNSSSARSLSFNETQGDQNFSRSYRHNSFLRESSGTIGKPYNRRIINFTLVIDSPLSPNSTTFIVNDVYNRISNTTFPSPLQHRLEKNYVSRSEIKCKEYCNKMIDTRPVIPLIGEANESLPKFNARETNSSSSVHRLVVGGIRAYPQNYPHVVALGRKNEENIFILLCGGSLISSNWVLTAAHCTHGITGGATIARLGVDRLSSEDEGEIIAIKRTVRHPSYKPPAMYADIALLELAESVNFSKSIKPACLHQQYHNIPISASVCGWGATEFGGNESDTLQEARLDLVDNVECALKHNRSISVPDGVVPSMICAGAPRNNWQQDTCHGDSGGPLQIINSSDTCVHRIIGITSFGAGCAFTDSPGVYTRVSHYLDWIEDIVWPEE